MKFTKLENAIPGGLPVHTAETDKFIFRIIKFPNRWELRINRKIAPNIAGARLDTETFPTKKECMDYAQEWIEGLG